MDLFEEKSVKKANKKKAPSYTAKDIEVLEGLEPVRKRPGMYIGGTDQNALHHLFVEILDNSMDESVAGYADTIYVTLGEDNKITITDNGRGIPTDPHPKFPDKSALEVILTTLHSGGKFSDNAYSTAGGLHGVGVSVVNALSKELLVKVKRDGKATYQQQYSKGLAVTKLSRIKDGLSHHGTQISFVPDDEIFPNPVFDPLRLYKICRSRAYLCKGVTIVWKCEGHKVDVSVPEEQTICYPNGLKDYLTDTLHGKQSVTSEVFFGEQNLSDGLGKIEWAMQWLEDEASDCSYYANTINTPLGGTHESGFKSGLLKALKEYAKLTNNKQMGQITSEDILASATLILSAFVKNPIFQGQTKDKLLSQEAVKPIENVIKVSFENWLTNHPNHAELIIKKILEDSSERLSRKKSKEINRKTAIKGLRLPGKLSDCANNSKEGSELFLVEGESAGGSAKQARDRNTQAVLPLKGKILNVENSTKEKILNNAEIRDLSSALGTGVGKHYNANDLRYEKIIIMTDADVDGMHITALLLTFFFKQMPQLVKDGHLYLAQPPLYRVTHKNKTYYAADDSELESYKKKFEGKGHVEIGRFKGLGEMTAAQLKETTMSLKNRKILRVNIADNEHAQDIVTKLMGKDPESRFNFIKSRSVEEEEKELLV